VKLTFSLFQLLTADDPADEAEGDEEEALM